MLKFITSFTIVSFLFSFGAGAQTKPTTWEGMLHEGRHAEAYSLARQQLQSPKADFLLGALALQVQNNDEAIAYLTSALGAQRDLSDYSYLLRGQAYLAKGEWQKALDDFKKAEVDAHIKFVAETSRFFQAEAHSALKQWKKAEPLYQKSLKKLQRTRYYPSAVWGYLVSQQKNNKGNKVCRQAKELYLKYPSFEKVEDWGIFLGENTVNGKKLGCLVTFGEQKLRVQRTLWAGLEEKAGAEIQALAKRAPASMKYAVDELRVSYLLHEGHVDEAQKLLAEYAKAKANDYDFLMLVGKVYSRSNNPQKGIESYYRAYQVSTRAAQAAPALFQSGFLSYYVGDYEGAIAKFKEFSQKYASHRMNVDSIWYVAWLQYLQKNYSEAEKSFLNIAAAKKAKPRQWHEHKEDKINYWTAMSLLRQGKKDQALERFNEMTHDESVGYYSVAAYQRANQITQKRVAASVAPKILLHENWWLPEAVAGAVKKDTEEDNLLTSEDPFEKKVDAILISESRAEDHLSEELVISHIPQTLAQDVKSVYFNNLERSMNRALALTRVGLDDLAYREVLDTEGYKLTNEQKQWLLNAHQSVNSFNRSVVLASYFYADQQAKLGLHHGKDYWTYSYPRAYDRVVEKFSRQFQTPRELIWSIMRAETIYRPDAISPVGARGLMQIMPRTGRKIASLGGEDVEVEDLLKPPVSIKYGSQYLQRLSKKFRGSVPLVAAAYNGGPHRVQAWMNYFGGLEMDEFIEHIPFMETRNYVKKVSKYYAIYNLIYNKKTDAMGVLAQPIGFKFEGSVPTMETWERL